jgi:hypothetical protein
MPGWKLLFDVLLLHKIRAKQRVDDERSQIFAGKPVIVGGG